MVATQRPLVTLPVTIAVALIFTGLVLAGGTYLRGTDQYWYVADTQTLLEGGPLHAQHVFPAQALQPDFNGHAHFVHNALGIYLVLPLSWLAGPLMGWVLTNILLILGAAVVVWWAVRSIAGAETAYIASCLTLVYPTTLWEASQPMLEPGCMLFSALAAWCFVKARKSHANWWALWLSLASLTLCRASYLPLLAVLPFIYLWYNRPVRTAQIVTASTMIVAVAIVYAGSNWLMPNGMPTSLSSLLNNTAPPEYDNMKFMYVTEPQTVQWNSITGKAARAAVKQMPFNTNAIFYWPFNLAVVLSLGGLAFSERDSKHQRLCLLAAGMIAVHLLQVVIHQNQFRYLVPGWPAILAAAIVTWTQLAEFLAKTKVSFAAGVKYIGIASIIGCCSVDLALTVYLVKDGMRESREAKLVQQQFVEQIPPESTVMYDANFETASSTGQPWIEYTLRPRKVVYMRDSISSAQRQTIVETMNPTYVLADRRARFPHQLGASLTELPMKWPEANKDLRLYRLEHGQELPLISSKRTTFTW